MTRGLHDKKDRPGRQWEKQHARGMLKCKWEFRLVAKKKQGKIFKLPFGKETRGEKKIPLHTKRCSSNKSNTKNMPTLPYAVLQIDFGRLMGCLRGLSLACLSVSSHLNDEHSRGLNWAQSVTKQFASPRWATKPTALCALLSWDSITCPASWAKYCGRIWG